MNFLQQSRVTALSEQMAFWQNPENMNNFYNNLPHFQRAETGVGKFLDGYVTYYCNTLTYNDLKNGRTLVLRKQWDDLDYVCYQDLYVAGESSGAFRCNKPVFREVVETGNGTFEYIEFEAPNGEYGENVFNDILAKGGLTKEYLISYIDDFTTMQKAASQVAAKHGRGVPLELGLFFDRFKDANGYFWAEALDWSVKSVFPVDEHLQFLDSVLKFRVGRSSLSASDIEEILSYARESWVQI